MATLIILTLVSKAHDTLSILTYRCPWVGRCVCLNLVLLGMLVSASSKASDLTQSLSLVPNGSMRTSQKSKLR